MDAELKASQYYKDATKKVVSEKGKNLLEQLSDFEQSHYNKLNDLKESLNTDGPYIKYDGTQFKSYKASTPSEVSGEIEPNKDELLEILNLAIDAETIASERYRRMAEETTDSDGKDMFMKLAEEENIHRRILSDEYYQMNNRGGIWFWGD